MSNKKASKRIAALNQASQQKKQQALLKTQQAIEKLIQNKAKITVRAVAKEADVSISYIYKYPELSYKIQTLRDAQKYNLQSSKKIASNAIENHNNYHQRELKLIQEIEFLKTKIEDLDGKNKSNSELKKENINLQLENLKLKQELKFIKQQLEESRNFILNQSPNMTQHQFKLETTKRVIKEVT